MKFLVHLNVIGVKPGGGYLSMLALAEWLRDRGHEVQILATRGRPIDGFRCTIGAFQPLYSWADVVLTQLAAAPTAIRLARAARKPVVHYVHNEGQLNGVAREDCALAIFNSQHLRDGAAWPGPQAVLHPIVRPNRYRVDRTGDAVLFVNPSEEKGSATVRALAERMPNRRFLVVAGRMSQVGEWPANVEVLPSTWDMRPIYERTRVVLMPSQGPSTDGPRWWETWGRTAIEAACSGIPTLAAPTPGLCEALGTAGHFLDRDDVDAWARCIERLDDAHVYDAVGVAAKERAAELDTIVSAQLEEVERLLSEASRPAPASRPKPKDRGTVDFFASARHYLDHLAPTWHALPPERRGRFVVTQDAAHAAQRHGIEAHVTTLPRSTLASRGGPVVVASDANMRTARAAHRPVILCSHGIGQSYVGVEHGSQAGGPGRDGVVLFLHPGEHPARRDQARYPNARVEVIGCPKLDAWTDMPVKDRDDPPTIAISFHWGSILAPEAAGTFEHFKGALPALAQKFRVLGHGHPKALDSYAPLYRALGIEIVPEFDDVLKRADLYVCDGISTLYEFAYTGRPVVVLNGPGYRRDVEHGLRFWECADVGVQCWNPAELPAAVELALEDPTEVREARDAALAKVYAHRGDAAQRAAAAIVRLLEDGVPDVRPARVPMPVRRWSGWGPSRLAQVAAQPGART